MDFHQSVRITKDMVFPVCFTRQYLDITAPFVSTPKQGLKTHVYMGSISEHHCNHPVTGPRLRVPCAKVNFTGGWDMVDWTCEGDPSCSMGFPVFDANTVEDHYWICGFRAYASLPHGWYGVCSFARLNDGMYVVTREDVVHHIPLKTVHATVKPESIYVPNRHKRAVIPNKRSTHSIKLTALDLSKVPTVHQVSTKAKCFWTSLFPVFGVAEMW